MDFKTLSDLTQVWFILTVLFWGVTIVLDHLIETSTYSNPTTPSSPALQAH